MHDLVDGALVAVEGEDHRLVRREQIDEVGLVHAVRVVVGREQGHQVHHVDHTHLQFGDLLRSHQAAATVSMVGMSPAHASTTSGS